MNDNDNIKIQIEKMIGEDFRIIENIGQKCLPIYYQYDDLLTMSFNQYQLLYKAVKINEIDEQTTIENKENANKEIIGFIVAEKQENNLRIHIKSIAVLPEYRRLGIGCLLINKMKSQPCLSITLIVSEKNEDAYRFYVKMGFKPIKKMVNYYHSLGKSGFLLYFENIK